MRLVTEYKLPQQIFRRPNSGRIETLWAYVMSFAAQATSNNISESVWDKAYSSLVQLYSQTETARIETARTETARTEISSNVRLSFCSGAWLSSDY